MEPSFLKWALAMGALHCENLVGTIIPTASNLFISAVTLSLSNLSNFVESRLRMFLQFDFRFVKSAQFIIKD